jgi:tRNA A37 threonylcarbamoyladenosine dehydratase
MPSAPFADPVTRDPDLERRFGGLRRLYGDAGYQRLRAARVAVIGLGGVGSWAVEALSRCGVAGLVLVDYDHVAESNIHRQLQATGRTLGLAKGEALRTRIADIHPACRIEVIDAFVEPDNWPQLLPHPVDAAIDACDQVRAKLVLAQWALSTGTLLVSVGAAGGKQRAERVELADLAEVTHDPLLSSLRQRLRKAGAPRQGRIGLTCVYSRETVQRPRAQAGAACDAMEGRMPAFEGSLNCAGYGSTVAVTASFGMVAAGEIARRLAAGNEP